MNNSTDVFDLMKKAIKFVFTNKFLLIFALLIAIFGGTVNYQFNYSYSGGSGYYFDDSDNNNNSNRKNNIVYESILEKVGGRQI